MRYFLKIAYYGTGFHGWQSQPNACSIQETIEKALSTILREDIRITGAGRTDTGVNARCMYAHFDVRQEKMLDTGRILSSINKLVGRNIVIHDLFPTAADSHARFDALERTYRYFVIYDKSPFLDRTSWLSPVHLDIEKMNQAACKLLGKKDFTSFSKLHTDVKTNICDVSEAEWRDFENTFGVPGIYFEIKADRFLRNMVRAIVGTLVDVGRGKLSVADFEEIINKKDRCSAGNSMPAHALFLWNVKYSFNN